MSNLPSDLSQFRVEEAREGIIHLIFDCPGRSMNVFSNKAIRELGQFTDWLHNANVRGVVIRSGKETGFCAGADLTELGVAYDMIIAASPANRFDVAYDHFFPLSHAIRRLETAGKPVAAAIGGVALGGGCELALGCHYRALSSSPRAVLGLPECQVGLLPGAGGTQRMPRLVGVANGLEVLLQGKTYSGTEALDAGLVGDLVEPGSEIQAAEKWVLSDEALAIQPWDRPSYVPAVHSEYAEVIGMHRDRELRRMLGHEPAPTAILDCVELGFMQSMDGAIRSEMSVFAGLIQRPEPRNMIRSMFLGKQAYDKAKRAGTVPGDVVTAAETIGAEVDSALDKAPALRNALFGSPSQEAVAVQRRPGEDLWLLSQRDLVDALRQTTIEARRIVSIMDEGDMQQLDYLVTIKHGIPAYVGGVSGLARLPF